MKLDITAKEARLLLAATASMRDRQRDIFNSKISHPTNVVLAKETDRVLELLQAKVIALMVKNGELTQ